MSLLCFSSNWKYETKIVPFSTGSDTEIKNMLDAYYNNMISWEDMGWVVGDTRLIHFNAMQAPNPNSSSTWAAQDITIVIVAHDHTTLATPINGHTKSCITVQTREVMNSDASGGIYINGSSDMDTTFTKWSNTYIRSYMNSILFGALPDNVFKSCIKQSSHYRHTTYNGSESELVTDALFLPSQPEMTPDSTYYVATSPVEGTLFKYFETASNRIKYFNNNGSSNGNYAPWWNGSASVYYSDYDYYYWNFYASAENKLYRLPGTNTAGLAPAWAM